MKGHLMKYTLIVLLSFMGLTSCDNNGSEQDSSKNVEQQVTTVSVLCQQRNAASGIDLNEDNNNDDTAPIIINSFEEGSLLYFSQMGPTQTPNFLSEDASPYLYIYEYNQNKNATWEDGYNFSVWEDRKPLDWATVKNVGSVGNAFSIYAMYFPIDNEVKFKVAQDQRGGKEDQYDKTNFMKSDIMGAYHATSSLYTRLRFRLFHLMAYLKVTLYVPDYEDELSDDNTKSSYSGFKEGALKEAFVINAYTDFNIEWRANRSSDTEAPLVQASGDKTNISMYRHNSDETKIIEDFNVKDYYTGDNLMIDKVRAYHFSVLFPSQSFGNDNFLCFTLETPEGAMKYYYCSGSQIMGDGGSFNLTQGTLQHLSLYLPRKTNETILVGAKILPWSDAVTDMTVTQQPSSNGNNN